MSPPERLVSVYAGMAYGEDNTFRDPSVYAPRAAQSEHFGAIRAAPQNTKRLPTTSFRDGVVQGSKHSLCERPSRHGELAPAQAPLAITGHPVRLWGFESLEFVGAGQSGLLTSIL